MIDETQNTEKLNKTHLPALKIMKDELEKQFNDTSLNWCISFNAFLKLNVVKQKILKLEAQ